MPRAIPPPVLLAVLLPCVDETWMNFFTKVLSRFASTPRLQPTVSFEVPPESNVTRLRIEETRTTLRKHIADALEGLDVVPGFSYPLVELLK